MKCQEVDKLINLYIDNMLDEELEQKVERHIADCDRCSDNLNELNFTADLLEKLPMMDIPHGFDLRLHNELSKIQVEQTKKGKDKYIKAGISVAVAALVIVILLKINIYDPQKADMLAQDATEEMDIEEKQWSVDADVSEERATGEKDEDELEGAYEQAIEDGKKGSYKTLTESVIVKVQDVCATPQAIERLAIIHDIEVIEVGEDSIIVEIDTVDKREILYEELLKLGEVRNMGEDTKSRRITINIVSK